jgi:hypothetical protein
MMRGKRPTNYIVGYSLKFIEKAKSLSGFEQYLLQYPGLSKREKNPWSVIQLLIDELNGALPEVRQKFDRHLNEILTFYYQLCCDQRSTYLGLNNAPMITAQVIFRLRKCFPPNTKRVLSPELINELLTLVSLQCESADARALCNALLGAGYLAMDGQLQSEVSSSVVNLSAAADPKYLCNVILGLGLLADKALLLANVSASLLNQILKALLDQSSALQCWHL